VPALPLPARPKLDRAAIVEAALGLLDEAGLDALSTRSLAAALGVKGPSLYWHFKGMAELRDAMADAVLAEALPAPDAPGDWKSWLASGARGYRRAALSRRDGARLLAGARPTEARRKLRFPANVARLEAAGFSGEDARAAFMVLARYAMGYALAEQAAGEGPTPRSEATFEFGLEAIVDGLEARLS
jgi:TetR/AcrR family transcriptional regulator, tetracycline repressor protein